MSRVTTALLAAWLGLLPWGAMHAVAAVGGADPRAGVPALVLPFLENAGRPPAEVALTATSTAGTTFITHDGTLVHVLVAPKPPTGGAPGLAWSLVERHVGSRPLSVRGVDTRPTGVTSVTAAGEVLQSAVYAAAEVINLYPGIDLRLLRRGNELERVYEVAPGARATSIHVSVSGAQALRLRSDGSLAIDTEAGAFALSPPVAWQDTPRGRRSVAVAYRPHRTGYRFSVGAHDPTRSLFIDPILRTTYVGGSGSEGVLAVAIHPSTGEVYVAGYTSSTDFPGTSGGTVWGAQAGAFVARYDATLGTLLQATLLPAPSAAGLAFAPVTGDVYVVGHAGLLGIPSNPILPSGCGGGAVYTGRLTVDLSALVSLTCYSVFGNLTEGPAIAVSEVTGEVYVTSLAVMAGGGDARPEFIVIYDPRLVRYSADLQTTLGSAGVGGKGVVVHPVTGNVYLLAQGKLSLWSPQLSLMAERTIGTSSGGAVPTVITVDRSSGDLYVAGLVAGDGLEGAAGGAQPNTPGPFAGYDDAFVARVGGDLSSVVQSTYFAGTGTDVITSLGIHPLSGLVYIAGSSESRDLPATAGSAQWRNHGQSDAFVAALRPDLRRFERTTYFGGAGSDTSWGVAISPTSGDIYLAGRTESAALPGTAGAAQPALAGPVDGFIARIDSTLSGTCAEFADVAGTDALCPGVAWMKSRAITLGCTSGNYCPHDSLNRLAMAAFMYRHAEALTPRKVFVESEMGPFAVSYSPTLLCVSTDIAPVAYPRVALVHATFSGLPNGSAVTFGAGLLFSQDGGVSWRGMPSEPGIQASSDGTQWSNAALRSTVPVAPELPHRFALVIRRSDPYTTGDFGRGVCQLDAVVVNANEPTALNPSAIMSRP